MINFFRSIILFTLLLSSGVAYSYEADFGFQFKQLPKKSSGELRVIWWNILQGGKLGESIEQKEGHNPLLVNLESLTTIKEKPDFLILGEYLPDEVKPEIDHLLRSRFRNVIYIPNSDLYPKQGILILTDLNMKIFTHPVGWGNQEYRDRWSKSYPASITYFDRTFIAIQYQWKGETRYLLPFHSLQPWMALKATYPERFSKLYTAIEILTCTTNPLFHQLQKYLSIMKTICNPSKNKVLMIGDLNTPDDILGFKPIGYQLLTSRLNDTFKRGAEYTFPAPSSVGTGLSPSTQKINQLRIDHALTSGLVSSKDPIRIPLRGSDHFPISVTITN